MEFNLIDMKITVQSPNPGGLAFCLGGSSTRFAAACRDVVCATPMAACEGCPGFAGCAWQVVFAQGLSTDPASLRRHQKPPLPFVFSFPFSDEKPAKPGVLECGLVVVGRAIPHLEMLLKGFTELLAEEGGKIIQIAALDYQGEPLSLGNGAHAALAENLPVLSVDALIERCPWRCSGITIQLLSPLRLMRDGRQCSRFDFSLFARSLMRRVSSLAYYYAEYEFDADFWQLACQADAVQCAADHFRSTHASGLNKKFAGITGSGGFIGEMGGLMPFLILGGYLHAGKGAAFGMGRYELIFD